MRTGGSNFPNVAMWCRGRWADASVKLVVDGDGLGLMVDLGCFRFVVLHTGFLVAQKVSNGLHNGSVLDGPCGA